MGAFFARPLHSAAAGETTSLQSSDDADSIPHAAREIINTALIADAQREWGIGHHWSGNRSFIDNATAEDGCTAVLKHYGLCDPTLLRVPSAPRIKYTKTTPFMFLHLSKCAGTSLVSSLAYMGYAAFTVRLPHNLATSSPCARDVSKKCCWWRERLSNMSAREGGPPKVLEQEPANDVHWIETTGSHRGVVDAVDPGFDAASDFCSEQFAYVTILRPPVERLHSHMCEIGVNNYGWQSRTVRRGHVKTQLRDNYYVRSLGGRAAWAAPEGALNRRHLMAAARALARFDVVMTVASLERDSPVQMARVGLRGFQWPHGFSRSRSDNLQRAARESSSRTLGKPSCQVPPTPAQLSGLVAACHFDAVLYEFARVLAARRTEALARERD